MIALITVCGLIGVGAAIFVFRPFSNEQSQSVRFKSLVGVAGFAIAVLAAYLVGAEPNLVGQPYNSRIAELRTIDPALLNSEEQEERLRDLVRQDSQDAEAAAYLGRFLAQSGRELEAIGYLERSARLDPNAMVFSDLGQALVMLNQGQITPEAERAFQTSLDLDSTLVESAFFLGVAAFDRGDRHAAIETWTDILEQMDLHHPFYSSIASRAADLLSRPRVGPGEDGVAPFASQTDQEVDMDSMITTMLAGLNERRQEDPTDLSNWLILARAQIMQSDFQAARETLSAAQSQFEDSAGTQAIIGALVGLIEITEREA